MTTTAKGEFEVELTPAGTDDASEGLTLGRVTLAKRFVGSLEAVGQGQMLTAVTPVDGSASYVAIERISGTLLGRRGSFALQHAGTMGHGEQHLTISVVPDSGTGQLRGLSGHMTIRIEHGKHRYELEFALPPDA